MKAVIFGTGDIAQIAAYYFERDGLAEVVAFTVDAALHRSQLLLDESVAGREVRRRHGIGL